MARLLFERQAVRRRNGQLANSVTLVVYLDEAGTTLADISATSGGSAISGSSVVTADIAGLGPASLRFWGPGDGTDTLYMRVPSDASLGVQKIEADPDPRLDLLEAGVTSGLAAHAVDTTVVHGIADTSQLARKLTVSDQGLWVSTQGSDANDGLSGGAAKLTVQAAHDALPATGGLINVLGGQYVHGGIDVTKPNTTIRGRGPDATTLKMSNGVSNFVIRYTINGGKNLTVEDLTCDGNKANQAVASTSLSVQGVTNPIVGVQFTRVKVIAAKGIGIGVGLAEDIVLTGVVVEDCDDNNIDFNDVTGALVLGGASRRAGIANYFAGHNSALVTYVGTRAEAGGDWNYDLFTDVGQSCTDVTYLNAYGDGTDNFDGFVNRGGGARERIRYLACTSRGATRDGASVSGGGEALFRDCDFNNNTGKALELFGAGAVTIYGGSVDGNGGTISNPPVGTRIRGVVGYPTEGGGTASVANSGSINHGLAGTPARVSLIPMANGRQIAVLGVDGTIIAVGLTDSGGSAIVTPEDVIWSAALASAL